MNTNFSGAANGPIVFAGMQRDRLRDLLWQWDMAPVLRLTSARVGWDTAYGSEVCEEYRRFVYVSVKNPGSLLGMCGPVDDLWHDHILYTSNYLEFCSRIAGRYLHHIPTLLGNGDRSGYVRTVALIEKHFGDVNWSIWPKVGEAEIDCCSQCGDHG